MDLLTGAISDLSVTTTSVNLRLTLTGVTGVVRLDYRADKTVLNHVGARSVIRFAKPPEIELISVTAPTVAYHVRAVHYNRASESRPKDVASVAAIPGSVELVRSQLLNVPRATIGATPNVTDVVKPDPIVGGSPCLDVAFASTGTSNTSVATLVIHCVFATSGDELPEYA
jgi:hypothetical protein